MKKQLFIVVRPVSGQDVEDVAGVYAFEPNDSGRTLSENLGPNAALDVFHSNIAIDSLDDYQITVVDEEGREQLPFAEVESYELSHYGDVYQSERTFEHILPAMPVSGSDGKHDWAIADGADAGECGLMVFVDDRPISYRPDYDSALALVKEVILRLKQDGDYRLNDMPQGFMPPPLKLWNDRFAGSVIAGCEADFDAIEVQGVRYIPVPGQEAKEVEVDNLHPEFFSVYVHRKTGGVDCVGDHATHTLAQAYAAELSKKYGWPVSDMVSAG